MTPSVFRVADPGPLTTVQDLGRYGFQRYGVPVSGAMDRFALRAGNLLLGNRASAAGLEMTMIGPTLKILRDCRLAFAGAEMPVELDGRPVPGWQAVDASAGATLQIGTATAGLRGYLCVSGGIEVPEVLGSRSTYLKSAFGGLEGRALIAGDVLGAGMPALGAVAVRGTPAPELAPFYWREHEIRVVLGPQHDGFTDEGKFTFLNSVFTVSPQSDRVGYRLSGPPVEHAGTADIVSDGTPMGAVQVPGDGQPIVLMADRGTTGGYPKIATVISADVWRLAQARPGDEVSFRAVTVEEAEQIRWEQEAELFDLTGFDEVHETQPASVVVDGAAYEVLGAGGEALSPASTTGDEITTAPRAARATVGGYTFELEVGLRRRS